MGKPSKLPRILGKKIQRFRKMKKLTQEELAEKVGISTTYMGNIEQGLYTPSLKVLEKIAKQLHIKTGELLL